MTKQYIIWEHFPAGNYNVDIDSLTKRNWNNLITYQDFNISESNGVRNIGIIDIDNSLSQMVVDRFKEQSKVFGCRFLTVEEALEYVNDWYPSKEEVYFELDQDNFTIIDNRPKIGL